MLEFQTDHLWLLHNQFRDDLVQSQRVRNDIRRYTLYRDRQADLATLLPNGTFENWLVHVTQVADGNAAILVQSACSVMLGSDACPKSGSEISATIKPDIPLFRELVKVGNGDFVAVSETILYAKGEQTQALPKYAMYRPDEYCSESDGVKIQDVFVTQIRYLIKMR